MAFKFVFTITLLSFVLLCQSQQLLEDGQGKDQWDTKDMVRKQCATKPCIRSMDLNMQYQMSPNERIIAPPERMLSKLNNPLNYLEVISIQRPIALGQNSLEEVQRQIERLNHNEPQQLNSELNYRNSPRMDSDTSSFAQKIQKMISTAGNQQQIEQQLIARNHNLRRMQDHNGQIMSMQDLRMKAMDSTEMMNSSPEQIKMQKIYHSTDPMQSGNGRQKSNYISTRISAKQIDNGEQDDDIMNHLYKSKN